MSREELAQVARRLGTLARRGVPIGPATTYRVGGPAALWCEPADEAELSSVAAALAGTRLPVLVVGKGSNLLVADAGFPGLVLRLGAGHAAVSVDGVELVAGGAASLPVVARRSAAAGLTGLEWAVGVPGSVGGGVRMNAGGHGSDVAASLVRVRVLDLHTGETAEVPASELALGYRRSRVQDGQVVTAARFRLRRGDAAASQATIAEIVRWRRENQPGGHNAGSVFTNPDGDAAGRLIDAAGCRGLRLGSAEVSAKHANFIQADPGGRADEVWDLLVEVRRRVHEATGVVLVPETRLVGFNPLPPLKGESR